MFVGAIVTFILGWLVWQVPSCSRDELPCFGFKVELLFLCSNSSSTVVKCLGLVECQALLDVVVVGVGDSFKGFCHYCLSGRPFISGLQLPGVSAIKLFTCKPPVLFSSRCSA